MKIDCHAHILATGAEPGATRFLRDMSVGYFQATGLLPDDRPPTEAEWETLPNCFRPISPEFCIEDHAQVGVDKTVILAVSPSDYTAYHIRGTVDPEGMTDVPGPQSIDKANDYIAAIVRKYPEHFIGMASVNPRYRGPVAAVAEMERAATELGLTGVKLYPGIDQYSPADRELAFPIYEYAQDRGIPLMVHMGLCPASDPSLEYERPWLLDVVGRLFPRLRVLVCHMGFPWVDECAVLVSKHPNFYLDTAYVNSLYTRREMFEFLARWKRWGMPLYKVCWGNDWPCFESLEQLLHKFESLNEEAKALGADPFSEREMAGMFGGNFLRFAGLSD